MKRDISLLDSKRLLNVNKKLPALRKILFKALIFFLPTQLAYHFWPNWSFVFGIRIDYLSPAIFLTDIFILLILFFWYLDEKRTKIVVKPHYILIIFSFIILNIFVAKNQQVAIFKWVKYIEIFSFILYLTNEKKMDFYDWVVKPLSLSLLFFSLLGLMQFIFQRTIGGPFYLLGERTFSASTPGITLGNFWGRSLMLPYSTFSHPNSMAGFFLVSLLFVGKYLIKRPGFFEGLVITASISLILLSLSLAVFLSFFVLCLLWILIKIHPLNFKKISKLLFWTIIIGGMLFLIILSKATPGNFSLNESWFKRVALTQSALQMINKNFLFGTGLNNFIVGLPTYGATVGRLWWLQPVHNIFLLVFSETGILGLMLFVVALNKILAESFKEASLLFVLIAIMLTGTFDHYWLTLQQNLLLLSLATGFCLRKNQKLHAKLLKKWKKS